MKIPSPVGTSYDVNIPKQQQEFTSPSEDLQT